MRGFIECKINLRVPITIFIILYLLSIYRYVDQGGGKRPGAFAVYIEPWHAGNVIQAAHFSIIFIPLILSIQLYASAF
jgi:hypothetical protein